CAETELGRTAVKSALAALEEQGLLTRERRRREDGSLGTYTYAFPHLGSPGGNLEPGDDPRPGAGDDPLNQEGVEPGSEPGELAPVPVAPAYDPFKGTKIEGRNIPWDELVRVTQADETAEKGRIAKALKTIRELVVRDSSTQTFLDPETGEWWIARQINARAAQYRRRWPNVELTPTALAANWSRVVTAQPGQDPMTTRDAAQRGIDSARRTACALRRPALRPSP